VLQLLLGYLTDTIKSYLFNLLNETDVPALLVIFQLIDGRPIPDWKKFLGVNANKQALPLTFMLCNKAMPSCISTVEERSKGVS
jgi:hypothetical protein